MKPPDTHAANRWIGLVWIILILPLAVHGQQSGYSSDPNGNLISIASPQMEPEILTQPQPALLQSNSPVAFSVLATGTGISYQWLSNGIAIAGATNDSLLLPNLSNTNGTFSVIVSNASGVVTSAPAALWADVNGNGIPDWWELKYFGNLNQLAIGDYDGDGVDNLDEYLEGTNPTNAASFDPRLYIQTIHGRVVASPDQPYYTMGQFITLTAIPDSDNEFIGWSGGITGTKSNISFAITAHTTVTATFGLPLGVALNNTNLTWTNTGALPWFGQSEISEDGIGAAQSGPIVDDQMSTFQTTVSLNQTNRLSFWWSVSCQAPDSLTYSIDGSRRVAINGTTPVWQQIQTNLPPGNHTLTWTYAKAGGDNNITGVPYLDAGWVGDVSVTPLVTQSNAPALYISLTASNTVVLSWPAPSTGFVLQENSSLVTTNWVNVTNVVNVVGGQNEVNLLPTNTAQFFRLFY